MAGAQARRTSDERLCLGDPRSAKLPRVISRISGPVAREASMSYKDLLVVLDAEPTARERTDLAAALAERFSAHLVRRPRRRSHRNGRLRSFPRARSPAGRRATRSVLRSMTVPVLMSH
jgi:hypothetical protein